MLLFPRFGQELCDVEINELNVQSQSASVTVSASAVSILYIGGLLCACRIYMFIYSVMVLYFTIM